VDPPVCSCKPGEGCDAEGDPGCAYCRIIDPEWPCPADDEDAPDDAPPDAHPVLGPCDVRHCPNEATAIVRWHYVCVDHIDPPKREIQQDAR
jgi:hypothetical protein